MDIFNNWTLIDIYQMLFVHKFKSQHIIDFVDKFNSLDDFYKTFPKIESELIGDKHKFYQDKIENIIKVCLDSDIEIITYWQANYPPKLREISSPPLILYKKGLFNFGDQKFISVVGTRKYTTYGKLNTERFVSDLIKNDCVIVSGLATGIDTISHHSVLANKGITIAVVASGLNKITPLYADNLAKEIIKNGGAIVSEYPPDEPAKIGYFPQRNRIVSGISSATLVVESGEKGGSLITARFAFEQNRLVFAIPGNITSEKSKGCNNLIKWDIAKICSDPSEILAELGWINNYGNVKELKINFTSELDKSVYELIKYEPVTIDFLLNSLDNNITEVSVSLFNLEFSGIIKQLPGKQYVRK